MGSNIIQIGDSSVRPSWSSGFARGPADAEDPYLWQGLVGAWFPSLGATGLTLHDVSGRRNNGTLVNGPTWVPEGIEFVAASEQYIRIPAGHAFNTGTLSLVIRMNADLLDDHVLFNKGFTTHTDPYYQFLLRLWDTGGAGRILVELAINGNRNQWGTAPGTIQTASGWHNIAMTYDGLKEPIVYVDGVPVDIGREVGADTSGPIASYDTDMTIGRLANTEEMWFDGKVSFGAAWLRGLHISEIRKLHAGPDILLRRRQRVLGFAPTAPVVGPTAGILHRGQMPGILARAG